jgi:hypothetical protein
MLEIGLCHPLLRSSAPHGATARDDVVPVTNACRMLDILVDHQNPSSARLQQRGVKCNSYVFLRTSFSPERRRLT